MSEEKQRTALQNKAMHVWFGQLASAFADKGLDMREVLKEEIDIPWTSPAVKEHIWRPIQKLVCLDENDEPIESTADLTAKQCIEVAEVINRHLGEKMGIHVPWPSDYERSLKGEGNVHTN